MSPVEYPRREWDDYDANDWRAETLQRQLGRAENVEVEKERQAARKAALEEAQIAGAPTARY